MFRIQNLLWYIIINQCVGLKPLCATFYMYLFSPWNADVGILVKKYLMTKMYLFPRCILFYFFLLVPVTTSSSQCANYMIDCWLTPTEKHFSFINSTLVSSSNKTDSHDITEILLKVALNTITLTFIYRTRTILQIINYEFIPIFVLFGTR